MRALVQRVSEASVEVAGKTIGTISHGLCIFVGVTHSDSNAVAEKLAKKIAELRIFEDDEGRMNLSSLQIDGQLLVISQFTLYGDVSRGRRPSWVAAAPPEQAEPLIQYFIECLSVEHGIRVETGQFQAFMNVSLINEGPATLMIEID
ncbi:MAG: D-aminoacyl-tRNA deacylase [Actinomycetota bacterium]